MNGDEAVRVELQKVDIYYDPDTDTLDIGTGHQACYGEDVAENLTVHTTEEGKVAFFVLSNASEVLFPYLFESMTARSKTQHL